MTCRDCIHFADCLVIGKTRYYGKDAACNNVEELCKYFKNKDNFVEVVRCKDCKHAKLDLMEKGLVVCRRPVLKNGQLLPFNWETKSNDFCSYGKRKEDSNA